MGQTAVAAAVEMYNRNDNGTTIHPHQFRHWNNRVPAMAKGT
jgi:hypothetical protein